MVLSFVSCVLSRVCSCSVSCFPLAAVLKTWLSDWTGFITAQSIKPWLLFLRPGYLTGLGSLQLKASSPDCCSQDLAIWLDWVHYSSKYQALAAVLKTWLSDWTGFTTAQSIKPWLLLSRPGYLTGLGSLQIKVPSPDCCSQDLAIWLDWVHYSSKYQALAAVLKTWLSDWTGFTTAQSIKPWLLFSRPDYLTGLGSLQLKVSSPGCCSQDLAIWLDWVHYSSKYQALVAQAQPLWLCQ